MPDFPPLNPQQHEHNQDSQFSEYDYYNESFRDDDYAREEYYNQRRDAEDYREPDCAGCGYPMPWSWAYIKGKTYCPECHDWMVGEANRTLQKQRLSFTLWKWHITISIHRPWITIEDDDYGEVPF